MKILLFGRNGQIARRLYSSLLPLGDVIRCGSSDVDFQDAAKLKEYIKQQQPDIIINAAAYTAVDAAESDSEAAFAINSEAVKIIADAANKCDAWFVHYSTDYVFDGTKNAPYNESDELSPLAVYGKSKADADKYIATNSNKHLIFRVSGVFDSHGNNFPKTILSLAKTKDSLRIINDQVGAPTSASLIAEITALALYKTIHSADSEKFSGIYNLSCSGVASWYDFAIYLIEQAGKMGAKFTCLPKNIAPIVSSEYPQAASRPLNTRLDKTKIENTFGIKMPSWKLCSSILLEELKMMGLL